MTGKGSRGMPHGTSRQRVSRSGKAGANSEAKEPTKRNAAGQKPVECCKAFVVTGGFLKQGHVVPTVEFDGNHFVKATVSENWLCKAATGKCRSLAPLSRTSVISSLRDMQALLVGQGDVDAEVFAPAGPPKASLASDMDGLGLDDCAKPEDRMAMDSGMAGLGLDDAMGGLGLDSPPQRRCGARSPQGGQAGKPQRSHGVSHLLLKQKARKQAARKAKKDTAKPRVVKVELPKDRQKDGVEAVHLLTRPLRGPALKSGIYLAIEAVPWLVGQARLEAVAGGVSFQPRESSMAKPHFSYRDKAWVARSKGPNGEIARRYFNVSVTVDLPDGRKRPATTQEIEARKEAAFQEALRWQEEEAWKQ